MDKIINEFMSSRLSTPDLLQQLSLLAWLHDVPEGKKLYEFLTAFRVGQELYQRVSRESEVEHLQATCVAAIAEFIKSHPHASEAELSSKVQQEIKLFSVRLNAL